MSHTPAPWIIQPDMYVGEEYYEPCVTTEQDEHTGLSKTIAVIRIGLEGSRANARLIAAAPELLEVARYAMQEAWDSAHPGGDPDDPEYMTSDAVLYRMAKAAITKAEGTQ